MPWWLWVILSPFMLICLGLALLLIAVIIELTVMPIVKEWQYDIRAKRHNKKALALRLAKDNWMGLPIPTGKSGHILLDLQTLAQFPYSVRQLDKILLDRQRDLGVDMQVEYEQGVGYHVNWRKPRKKKVV